ncbi:hypothetical protein DFR72_10486 [Lentzea flaviverrucosa]|nr:hypothetical protein DFR72_10486 [Lentzea flaviverrucosa]SER27949.1 hypothetical protein SAMN05216195_104541 [Lentzea flaviverrucosa]
MGHAADAKKPPLTPRAEMFPTWKMTRSEQCGDVVSSSFQARKGLWR